MILSPLPLYVVPLVAALGAALLFIGGDLARRVRLGLGSLALAASTLVAASAPLLRGQIPFTAGPRLSRVGSLDACLNLSLTSTSALLAGAVLVGAIAILAARPLPSASGEAGIVALVASLLLALLADGYPAFLAGWLGFGVTLAALVGRDTHGAAKRILAAVAVGSVALTFSAAFLFWGLGGKFLDGRRYLADYRARFIADSDAPEIQTRDTGRGDAFSHLLPNETGELTMLTYPGATVYRGVANEAQITPKFPVLAVAPFVGVKVPSGVDKIAIDPGPGAIIGGDGHDIALVDEVRFPPGSHVTLALVGPTVAFREIDDQVAHAEGDIELRKLGPLPLLDGARAALLLALLALGLGVGARGAGSPATRAMGGLGAVALAGALGDRLAPIFATAWTSSLTLAVLLAAAALMAAVISSRAQHPEAIAARTAAWIAFSVTLAIPFGAPAAVALAGAGASLGAVGIAIVVERERILRGAPTVAAATRPAMIALFAGMVVVATAISFAALVRGGVSGVAVASAILASAGIGSFAHFRAFFMLQRAKHEEEASTAKAGKKRKKKRAAPREEAPSTTPLLVSRVSAFVAAVGCASIATFVWLSRGASHGHGAVELMAAAAAAGLVFIAFLRARGLSLLPGFDASLESESESWLGRIAREPGETRGATGPGLVATALLRIDALLAWPASALGEARDPSPPDDAKAPE